MCTLSDDSRLKTNNADSIIVLYKSEFLTLPKGHRGITDYDAMTQVLKLEGPVISVVEPDHGVTGATYQQTAETQYTLYTPLSEPFLSE